VEHLRVDDALDEIGPGGSLRGRRVVVGRMAVQAAIATTSGASVRPLSPSNR
jgi:hypothetical protein